MKQTNRFAGDMLDFDLAETAGDALWRAMSPTAARQEGKAVTLEIPFQPYRKQSMEIDNGRPPRKYRLTVRAYGDSITRVSVVFGAELPADEDNPMLEIDASLEEAPLRAVKTGFGWRICDFGGRTRMETFPMPVASNHWSDLIEAPPDTLNATVFAGETEVPFAASDTFFPKQIESVGLGFIERDGRPVKCLYSVKAVHDEKFAGTGERFAKMDLSGQTLTLENTDGLGVNSRRAYKNVPFFLSSRNYGLLTLTSAHMRLSLADISKRSIQGIVEDDALDLFFIGGSTLERVLYRYRQLTGFPRDVPLWSYGIWMSRMTYFSAGETREVAKRLREGGFPCDVLHLDTGWFRKDWLCEWEFNPERFPDPEGYFREMLDDGFRISLWQLPSVAKGTKHYEIAAANGYLAPKRGVEKQGSNFGGMEYGGAVDFTNPAAVCWYQGLLEKLLHMGATAIKTDFGEEIDPEADYFAMPYARLHNLYCLLYQKAAFDVTQQCKGKGHAVIWARAGWTGCQRYPVHWGGDCACTWEDFAGSIRGGLHLGLSGFAFWSHDVPGFHGLPDFMNSRPSDELYVRWTQAAVFGSHIRYHGTSAREPYEYPLAAPAVRKWWNLRYALIPYLYDQGRKAARSGYPVCSAMVLHHQDDSFCWRIDDQFYCGDDLLVAPVFNLSGVRDVYLPEGEWVDFWTGRKLKGPRILKNVRSPLKQIPVYAKFGSKIRVYPEAVRHTGEMDLDKAMFLAFDHGYKGLGKSVLGDTVGL